MQQRDFHQRSNRHSNDRLPLLSKFPFFSILQRPRTTYCRTEGSRLRPQDIFFLSFFCQYLIGYAPCLKPIFMAEPERPILRYGIGPRHKATHFSVNIVVLVWFRTVKWIQSSIMPFPHWS